MQADTHSLHFMKCFILNANADTHEIANGTVLSSQDICCSQGEGHENREASLYKELLINLVQ